MNEEEAEEFNKKARAHTIEEANKCMNALVMDRGSFKVTRLTGWGHDGEDYYFEMHECGKYSYHCTISIGFILLKGYIDDKDYDYMLNCFEMNY